jgi:hypothetical protein
MSNRETMQQALECIERLNAHGWILADFEDEVYAAIAALREALAREHALHELSRLGQEIEQEPTPWRDMIVVSLVREGIDKHRARELADHFAAQPEQEPVAWTTMPKAADWDFVSGSKDPTNKLEGKWVPLYAAPPQRPWQGLTDEDWWWVADKKGTSLDTFDQGAAWAQQRLMERNK